MIFSYSSKYSPSPSIAFFLSLLLPPLSNLSFTLSSYSPLLSSRSLRTPHVLVLLSPSGTPLLAVGCDSWLKRFASVEGEPPSLILYIWQLARFFSPLNTTPLSSFYIYSYFKDLCFRRSRRYVACASVSLSSFVLSQLFPSFDLLRLFLLMHRGILSGNRNPKKG